MTALSDDALDALKRCVRIAAMEGHFEDDEWEEEQLIRALGSLVALARRGAALEGLAGVRDELLDLITVPPKPRRAPHVQGCYSVDVIQRAVAAIDVARAASLTETTEDTTDG